MSVIEKLVDSVDEWTLENTTSEIVWTIRSGHLGACMQRLEPSERYCVVSRPSCIRDNHGLPTV